MINHLSIDMYNQENITVTCNGVEVILSKQDEGLAVYMYGKPNKHGEQALIGESWVLWSEAEPYEDSEVELNDWLGSRDNYGDSAGAYNYEEA